MKKPLLLTLEYPPQHGGVAKYLEGEVKNFSGEVVVSVVKKNWKRLFGGARREFKKSQCDYLWVSHVLPIGYIALVWKCFYKTPYRVYLHGLDLVRPLKSSWKKFWVKMILQNADEIITNSNATARLLDNYGIHPSRSRVQYPRIEQIDIEKYKPIGRELRQKYNIAGKPILLTISRLVKRKGIDLVIRALPAVWQQIPDLTYVVAGEGEERENLEQIKKDVMLEPRRMRGDSIHLEKQMDSIASVAQWATSLQNDRIIFTGSVAEEEKWGWLAACDCFILTPTLDPNDFEGYGIVYKEAQMFGKPVIGSRVGGVPEAVGNVGVLVRAGDAEQIARAILKASLSSQRRG